MSILSLVLFVGIAAACAYLAQKLVPDTVPGGTNVSILVGAIGAYLGSTMLGSYGPEVYGVSLVPCILGSTVLVFALSLLSRALHKKA